MIRKILSNQSKTITGAAIILGAASFISRFIGIIRDRVFAHTFGAGTDLDTYYAAFRIPDLVYNLVIVGALSAGFIPIFTKLLNKDKKEAWQVTNGIINILGLFLLIVIGVLFIFTPQIMSLMVPGFSAKELDITVGLTRIMLLSPIILGLSSIVSGVLQSFKSFFVYALTPIVYNIGIIIGAIFFVPVLGLNGLAYGVVLGALLHLGIQIPTFIKHGFRYKPIFFWKNKNIKKIGKLMIPRTLGLATTQINLVVITFFASTVGVGSIAVFNFANNIQHFPVGIIGISFAIAAFPTLSQLVAEDKKNKMIEHLTQTIRQIIFFIIPLSIIFLLLRAQIVRVVLGSGQFSWADTINTADTLAFFTFSLFAQALIPLMVRVFFAIQDTWTPFLIGLSSSLINIIAGLILKDIYGVSGLALAFSIAMIFQLVLLWIVLRAKLGTLKESLMVQSIHKIAVASLVMSISVQFIKTPLSQIVDMTRLWGIFTQGAIAGILGLLVYGAICYMLKLEEMIQFHSSLQRKFIKIKNVQRGEITEADEI
jgi:putative peptidoglycan lipid II flippase